MSSNNVQRFRESRMLSKAELARKAGLSTLTIDRVEAGRACRLDTKRKILLALDLKISDKDQVFGGEVAEHHTDHSGRFQQQEDLRVGAFHLTDPQSYGGDES